MKPKMFVTVFLVVFVMVSVAFLVYKEIRNDEAPLKVGEMTETSSVEVSSTVDSTGPLSPNTKVDIVYYFMTAQRCPSCLKIESYTKEAVEKNFADDLNNGRLVWRMLAVDNPENYHFVRDYQLYTKSVVLVKIREGKQISWKNLEKVWYLLDDKDAFEGYITDEVKSFVEKG